MNAFDILEALDNVDDEYILQAREHKKRRRVRRTLLIAAAVAAVLVLCGFAAYQSGLFDFWRQEPSPDPTETVRSAIENQADKEYTISVRVEELWVDEAETKRVAENYTGSELAASRGWSDEYIAEHFVVVNAIYYVEYDHTKTFMPDGLTQQYFYLAQDVDTGEWTITDNTSPNVPNPSPAA